MSTDAIAAARALLPAWVVWSPLATLALQAGLCALMAASAVAYLSRPLRRLAPEAHWTERARLVWPVRRAVGVAWLLALVATGPLELGGQISRPGTLGRWTIGPITSLVAALIVAYAFENRFVRRIRWRTRWRGAAGYAVLVFPAYWVSGAFAIFAVQAHLSPVWSLVAGLVIVALAIGAAPWLGRVVGLVRSPPPRVAAVLSRARHRVGGPGPRLLVLPIPSANAFAFQLTRTVGVTQGALDALDDEELEAVFAHELGHLHEPGPLVALRTIVSAFLPVSVVVLPWVLEFRSQWDYLPLWAFAVAVLLLYRRLQRALERRSDAIAQAVSPAYAAALEKVYRTNDTPAVLRRPASHPDLFDRMLAAGVTPAWPRPAPPPSLLPALALLVALAGTAFAGAWRVRSLLEGRAGTTRHELAILAAVDGRAVDIGRLGWWHLERREHEAALTLFRAAEAMDLSDATWPALIATVLSYQGRCGEAGEASRRAHGRDPSSPHVQAAHELVAACAEPPR